MSAKGFSRGSFGDLVGLLQTALQRDGFYTGRVDGDFGGGTERAVKQAQTEAGLAATGRADPSTWQHATGQQWPSLFERCLQVTARLEGHGYSMVAGNFDGAGLTWGVIGFTLKHGEIQALVSEALLRDPELIRNAFGDRSDELIGHMLDDDWKTLRAWSDAISLGAGKVRVAQPWRDAFQTLGRAPLMQLLQRERARRQYFEPALETATGLQLGGELGTALAFDIQVQNGGVKKADRRAYETRIARARDRSAGRRRRLLAELVAASANARWRADVAARKNAIASGSGEAHGLHLELEAWGMDLSDPA